MRRPAWWWGGVVAGVLAHAVVLFGLYRDAVGWPVTRRLDDLDGPWHLACGRLIVEAGSVPREDPLCFTSAGVDWVNLNWLAQVALYRLYLAAGWQGPIVLAAVLLAVALAATLDRLRRRGVPAAVALLALAPVAWLLVHVHTIRPQGFTFALLAVAAWLLDLEDPERRLGPRRAAALAALLAVWGQLHGGFVFGLALVGLDAVGSALDARRAGRGWLPPRVRWLAAALAAGTAGLVAAHPCGVDALWHAATYTRQLGPVWLTTVGELMPLQVGSAQGRLAVGLAALAALGLVLDRRGARLRDLLPLGLLLALTVRHQRAVVPLVLVAVPGVVELVAGGEVLGARARALAGRVAGAGGPLAPALGAAGRWLAGTTRALPVVLPLATCAWGALSLALARPGVPGALGLPLDPDLYPVAAAEVLRREHPRGRVFNTFNAGGLLTWALGPTRRLTIDGRGDLHHASGVDVAYRQVMRLEPGWAERLASWDVEVALVPDAAPVTSALGSLGWRTAYDDGAWSILTRPPRGAAAGTR